MSFVDKAKEVIGEKTGNEKLEAEGKADQGKAGLKQAGENVKDGVSDAKDAIKGAFKKD